MSYDQLNSNTIFRWQLFPFLIKLSMSSISTCNKTPGTKCCYDVSSPPPSPPSCFHPGHGGRGRPGLARPSPVTTHTAQLVPGSLGVNTSVTWGEITHCDTAPSVSSSMKMGSLSIVTGVCLNINILVWWELLKSPSVNPWDVFLVVISPSISSIYYCFSIEHSNCHSVDDDTGLFIEVADIISELLNSVTAVAQVTPAVL